MLTKKMISIVICLMACLCLEATKTKKLQVVLNPSGPDFNFHLNDGNGISTDSAAPRPVGSYFLVGGLIFPDDTFNKNQSSFLVDKHGNPVSASDSIGNWQTFEKMLATIDNMNFLPEGTRIMMSEWALYFNKKCDDKPNNVYLTGFGKQGTLDGALIKWILTVIEGDGCNHDNNSAKAKLYIGEDGTSLINIKFDDEIKYND